MKVIRHGNTHKEVECPKCGALLSYTLADVKMDFGVEEYFGEMHSYDKRHIICPECKRGIIFSLKVDGEEVK